MTETAMLNHYVDNYASLAEQLPGKTTLWLQAFRNQGLQAFSNKGFPSSRDEDWRYTNLGALTKDIYSPSSEQVCDAASLDAFRLQDASCVVLVNGRFSAALSTLQGLPDTVSVLSFAQALAAKPATLQNHLGKAVDNGEHSLIAFNNAWFADGVLIEIAAGQQLDKPLQILHMVTENAALAASRNIVVVAEHAQAQIVETFAGLASDYFTLAVTECFLAENADLQYTKLQLEAEKATHFGGLYVKQAAHSHLHHHNFAFGGLLARSDIRSDLQKAAECTLNGLYLGRNRQHIDNHTRINHLQPDGISREYYKGVLDQRSRGVFQGRVVVAEDAQKTDSQMNNRNLLLSGDAEVDTKPQLEIYADDVKCAHGVTVGQLDEKSIFYLQSRGLDIETARNILTFAFANEMVEKVVHTELKALLLKQLLAHFPAISL